jgi:methylmalonyl-CoA/ethylmalonyl-CoA epimerase
LWTSTHGERGSERGNDVSAPSEQSEDSSTSRLGAVADEPLFLAIDHVGVAVPDLDQAIAYYAETFGMHLVHEEVNEDQGVREAMVAVGDSGSCIQLLAPLRPDSTIAKYLDKWGPGLQQIAYRVADVQQVADTLRSRGVRLLYDEPRKGTAGALINFIHPKDAGGVLVELVQPAR